MEELEIIITITVRVELELIIFIIVKDTNASYYCPCTNLLISFLSIVASLFSDLRV